MTAQSSEFQPISSLESHKTGSIGRY